LEASARQISNAAPRESDDPHGSGQSACIAANLICRMFDPRNRQRVRRTVFSPPRWDFV